MLVVLQVNLNNLPTKNHLHRSLRIQIRLFLHLSPLFQLQLTAEIGPTNLGLTMTTKERTPTGSLCIIFENILKASLRISINSPMTILSQMDRDGLTMVKLNLLLLHNQVL